MFGWLASVLLLSGGEPPCVPSFNECDRSSLAQAGSFDRLMDRLERVDIESREAVAGGLGVTLGLERETPYHRMWKGRVSRTAAAPEMLVDYREAIAGTGARSMLVIDILSPTFSLASARTRYPLIRQTSPSGHASPETGWSYHVDGREPALVIGSDHSNTYIDTIAFLPTPAPEHR